jgi:hypothetical protein
MRQQRSLKPRSRESVTNRQIEAIKDNGSRTGIPAGDKSINPKLKNVRLERLRCYNGGKTVIRIWPMLDPENPTGSLLNGRLSAHDFAGLGGMSISEPVLCVQYAGINRDSGGLLALGENPEACSYIIAKNKSSTIEGVKFWDEPYVKLYTVAKKAMDAGVFGDGRRAWDSAWNPLLRGKMPALSAFKQKYFIVCSIYENGNEFNLDREKNEYMMKGKLISNETPRNGVPLGDGPNDPLIVIGVSVSAGKKILELCNREKEDWTGDEVAKPYLPFVYGDPTGRFDPATNTVKGGLFFTLYNPTKLTIDSNSSFKGVANPQAVEYEAAVSKTYDGPGGQLTPSLSEQQVDNVFNKHVFLWKAGAEDGDDSHLLQEISIEERCVLLAKAFKQVPKLLEFSWMSNPEYLNYAEVSAILNRRSLVAVTKPAEEEDEDFDSDEVAEVKPAPVVTKPKPKVEVSKPVKKSASEIVDEFEDELDEDDLEDDDGGEEEIASKGSKQAKPKADEDEDDFEDDFDDAEDAGKTSKSVKAGKTSKVSRSKSEDEDLESDDFDDEADNSDIEAELEDQLNQSVSKANAIALSRSQSRTSPAPEPKKPRRSQ